MRQMTKRYGHGISVAIVVSNLGRCYRSQTIPIKTKMFDEIQKRMRQEHLRRFVKHCRGSLETVTKPTLSPAFPVPSATRLFSTAPEYECTQHTQQAYTTHNTHRQGVVASLCCHQVDFVALRCCRRVVALLSSFSSSSVVLFPLSFPSPHSLSSPFSCQQCSTREHERKREREGKWCMCLWWSCGAGSCGGEKAGTLEWQQRQQKSHI